jgi:hypothetical protein
VVSTGRSIDFSMLATQQLAIDADPPTSDLVTDHPDLTPTRLDWGADLDPNGTSTWHSTRERSSRGTFRRVRRPAA